MNMMDMVMALIAVVFFTTISMVYNRSLHMQTDNLNDATLIVQSTQICHSVLDEIDAKLFSHQLTFSTVISNYNFTQTRTYPHLGAVYQVQVVAVDCDTLGVTLASPPSDNPNKKVTVTVRGPAALRSPVTLQRLYTKTNLHI